jgi:phenylpyruvate tautomerase PptA (4-oxalocrotonate tautomerase family)
MPLVMIYSPTPADSKLIKNLISNVQTEGAKALGCDSSNVWVLFQNVSSDSYIQGSDPSDNSPLIIIKAQTGRSKEIRTALAAAVTAVVGRALDVSPRKIWVQYQEMNPQDVWFEGHWAG